MPKSWTPFFNGVTVNRLCLTRIKMPDIGFSELLLIAIAALIAIGPEDLPGILFRFGRFIRQFKIFMNDIRNQYADIMHEAEVQHYRKQFDPSTIGDAPVMLPKTVEERKDDVDPATQL